MPLFTSRTSERLFFHRRTSVRKRNYKGKMGTNGTVGRIRLGMENNKKGRDSSGIWFSSNPSPTSLVFSAVLIQARAALPPQFRALRRPYIRPGTRPSRVRYSTLKSSIFAISCLESSLSFSFCEARAQQPQPRRTLGIRLSAGAPATVPGSGAAPHRAGTRLPLPRGRLLLRSTRQLPW